MLCAVTRLQAITTTPLPAKAVKVRGEQADLCLCQDLGPAVLNMTFHICDGSKQISLFFKLTVLQRIVICLRNPLSNTFIQTQIFTTFFEDMLSQRVFNMSI